MRSVGACSSAQLTFHSDERGDIGVDIEGLPLNEKRPLLLLLLMR